MRRAAEILDAFLGRSAEVLAALLVVAETVILFSGVAARYVFPAPLVWSDELASILFIWLAMFGAAVAFRNGSHMRMTAFAASVGPSRRHSWKRLASSRRYCSSSPCCRSRWSTWPTNA